MNLKKNQIKAGSLISYIQMALSIIIGILYTPFMLQALGKSEYGLYSTVSSTISLLSLLSLGFNSGYIRYFAKYKKDNDEDSIAKLNGLFIIVFTIIGVIALICGTFLSNNLNFVFDQGLTESEYSIAHVLMLLLTVNLAITFPMSVFQNIISANERFVFLKLLSVLRTVLSPLLTLPLLLMGYRSIAMVIVTVSVSFVVDICYFIYVKFVLCNRFCFHGFETGLLKSIFVYTSFIAINLVIDQINWNIDKVLLARYKGTTSVAIYSVGYTLYSYYQMFSTSISGVFTPRIHNICNKYKKQPQLLNSYLSDLFVKVGRIQFLILALIASGLCFFGQSFIRFWAGEGYENAYYVVLLLVIPASIALIQNLGIEIQRAENKHQFRSIVYAVMAIINLISSIILCQIYGEIGAAIGTAVSLIIANGIIMNIYYYKKCGINTICFWKNIIRMSVGLLLPILAGFIINRFISFDTIGILFVWIVIYSAIYCLSMWLFGMNQYEKELVTKPIKKLLKR